MSSVSVQKARFDFHAIWRALPRTWALWLGGALIVIPLVRHLAADYWSSEVGGHGPLILATGIWLLWRERRKFLSAAEPGDPRLSYLVFALSLLGVVVARMTSMLGPEGLSVYAALLAIVYYHAGWRAIRAIWFPLVYMLFMLPEPEVIVLPITRELKLMISQASVLLLANLGYGVGHNGVVLFVDQYELLVASACSGLNSVIGLGAVGVFYAYLSYGGNWRAAAPTLATIPLIALAANYIRVVILILVTHYWGIRVAQVYIHDVAALLMFFLAVLLMVGVDGLIGRIRTSRLLT